MQNLVATPRIHAALIKRFNRAKPSSSIPSMTEAHINISFKALGHHGQPLLLPETYICALELSILIKLGGVSIDRQPSH
jgi:hypothetical protein